MIVVQAGCRRLVFGSFASCKECCRVFILLKKINKKKKRRRAWICKYASSCYFQINREKKRERNIEYACTGFDLDGKNKNYITYMFKNTFFKD